MPQFNVYFKYLFVNVPFVVALQNTSKLSSKSVKDGDKMKRWGKQSLLKGKGITDGWHRQMLTTQDCAQHGALKKKSDLNRMEFPKEFKFDCVS